MPESSVAEQLKGVVRQITKEKEASNDSPEDVSHQFPAVPWITRIEFARGPTGKVTVVFGRMAEGDGYLSRSTLLPLRREATFQDAQVDDRELYLVNYPEMEARSADKNLLKLVCASISHMLGGRTTSNDLFWDAG